MITKVCRADRVALHISITYRLAGDEHWIHSRTVNMSETGVLFGPTNLQPGARVELLMASPIAIHSLPPGRVMCMARVVRTTEAGHAGAEFESSRFVVES
jgi:hypothetical protein